MASKAIEDVPLVLVTGVSGFVAAHCAQQLLAAGYRVRGTVRSVKDESKVSHLRTLCPDAVFPMELVEADLLAPASWGPAISGCSFVLHVASPFPANIPKNPDDVIKPAVDGTLNVLRAVADDPARTVRRVVLTSSVGAMFSGRDMHEKTWDEADWSVLDDPRRPVNPYPASKTLAERAAWDFVRALPPARAFELTAICPGLICGPFLGGVPGTGTESISRLLLQQFPAIPDMIFPGVDVRDVAKAHVLAMRAPGAAGRRLVCAPFDFELRAVARLLKSEFDPQGYRVCTTPLPWIGLRILAAFDSSLYGILPHISTRPRFDHGPAEQVLGLTSWRGAEESAVQQAYSLIAHGVVGDRSPGGALMAAGPSGASVARERAGMVEVRAGGAVPEPAPPLTAAT